MVRPNANVVSSCAEGRDHAHPSYSSRSLSSLKCVASARVREEVDETRPTIGRQAHEQLREAIVRGCPRETRLQRLAVHVRFDTPDEAERELLWRTQIPSGAPVASDIDYTALARKFDMAGGHIRNAVLRAAFLASDAGTSISMTHLWRSALNEYESMGKISYNSLS